MVAPEGTLSYCPPIIHIYEYLTHDEGEDPLICQPGPFNGTKMYSLKRRFPSGRDLSEETGDPGFSRTLNPIKLIHGRKRSERSLPSGAETTMKRQTGARTNSYKLAEYSRALTFPTASGHPLFRSVTMT